ncbi:TPA: hypothetical protein ACH3X2_011853 [Trebouxia sp. C0005]
MAWPAVTSPESNFATPDQAHKALTLQLVHQIHYWIECCLLRGLDQAETTCVLQQQLGLQPCLTRIVWNQLEVQNPQFFSLYSKGSVIKVSSLTEPPAQPFLIPLFNRYGLLCRTLCVSPRHIQMLIDFGT